MALLLVIDRDDSFLPKGWVSAVLPDGCEPTEYERSGALWKAVAAPGAAASLERAAGGSFFQPSLVMRDGELIPGERRAKVIKDRISRLGSSLKAVPGPETLDRSSSTVWDYGPGRTYSTPQAAFDALVAQVGSSEFTETHYLRGWPGTYGQGPSGAVLALTTVSPTRRYPLFVDAQQGESVIFDDEGGAACLYGDGVSHVRASDLVFMNTSVAVAPADPSVGGALTKDWRVLRCLADGKQGPIDVGVAICNTDLLRILHCDLHDLNLHGVGGLYGYADSYKNSVQVSGCSITASMRGIWSNAETRWLITNNTIKSGFGLKHDGSFPLFITALVNNVYEGTESDKEFLQTETIDPCDVHIMNADGNCFHPLTAGKIAKINATEMNLDQWRQWFDLDWNSVEADPLLDDGLAPGHGSPCLGLGTCLDRAGRQGLVRAASIDAGFEQITLAGAPAALSRQAPAIERRT